MKKALLFVILTLNFSFVFAQSNNYGFKLGRPSILMGNFYSSDGQGIADVALYYSRSFKNNLSVGTQLQSDLFISDYFENSAQIFFRSLYSSFSLSIFAEKSYIYGPLKINPVFHIGYTAFAAGSKDYTEDYKPHFGFNNLHAVLFSPEVNISVINDRKVNLGVYLSPKFYIIGSAVTYRNYFKSTFSIGLFAEIK